MRTYDAPPQHPAKLATPKNPVVLCHGLFGFDSVDLGPVAFHYWKDVENALKKRGVDVLVSRVPATSSPMERAEVLAENISRKYSGRSVHLIGYSMGGLDCRYLATHVTKRDFRILSVTTIAAPHRGSPMADSFDLIINNKAFLRMVSGLDEVVHGVGSGEGFKWLTADNMRLFNETTPDAPGVKYFSWGASYEPTLLDLASPLLASHAHVTKKEGPNDGLVSEESARWGTYLGTLPNVSHFDIIGWIPPIRYKVADFKGKERFQPLKFYFRMMNDLARLETDESDETREKSTGVNEFSRTQATAVQSVGFVLGACNATIIRTKPA